LWDALVEAARRLTGAELLPDSHGVGARLVVTVQHEALRTAVGAAALSTGGELSAAAVRRLACDAEVLPVVLGSRSQVLDVGRSTRLVTSALWHALTTRDGQCTFPGCNRPPIACDAHHVRHWVDGGSTSLDNLVLLCRRHHSMVHQTPWRVRINRDDGRPEFLPPGSEARQPIRNRCLRL